MKKPILIIVLFFISLNQINSQSLMTVRDIYNYNIGDIFIRKAGGIYSPPTYTKAIITGKVVSAQLDSILYIGDYYYYTPPACMGCLDTYDSSFADTSYITNLDDTIGAGLGVKPHTWYMNCIDTAGYTGMWVDTVFYDPDFCNKRSTVIAQMGNGPQLTDSCYSYFEPYFGNDEFSEGLGQVSHYYNTCSTGFPYCMEQMILLYYIKGNDTCGTPYIFPTGINELTGTNMFKIAPNPFSSQTKLTFLAEQQNTTVILCNAIGEVLKKINFSGKELTIQKDQLKKGFYFLQVTNNNTRSSIKLIIN